MIIELPETLALQAQKQGISQQNLQTVVRHVVQIYLHELDQTSSKEESFAWTDGQAFAKQLIADNRALFEELARL